MPNGHDDVLASSSPIYIARANAALDSRNGYHDPISIQSKTSRPKRHYDRNDKYDKKGLIPWKRIKQ